MEPFETNLETSEDLVGLSKSDSTRKILLEEDWSELPIGKDGM